MERINVKVNYWVLKKPRLDVLLDERCSGGRYDVVWLPPLPEVAKIVESKEISIDKIQKISDLIKELTNKPSIRAVYESLARVINLR